MTRTLPTLLLLTGCPAEIADPGDTGDTGDTGNTASEVPCLTVDTERVDFGVVRIDSGAGSEGVTLGNDCPGILQIDSITLAGGGAAAFSFPGPPPSPLAERESTTLAPTFYPDRIGEFQARVDIASNDPEQPVVTVELTGIGGAGAIDVDDPGSFREVAVGCSDTLKVTIRNTGNLNLKVTGATAFTAAVEEFTLELSGPAGQPPPFALAPFAESGEEATATLAYAPVDTFGDDVFVTITSDDPYAPEVVVSVDASAVNRSQKSERFVQPAGVYSFTLADTPLPGTLSVTIDGMAVKEGVASTFDSSTNALVFSDGYLPERGGSIVDAKYRVEVECE